VFVIITLPPPLSGAHPVVAVSFLFRVRHVTIHAGTMQKKKKFNFVPLPSLLSSNKYQWKFPFLYSSFLPFFFFSLTLL